MRPSCPPWPLKSCGALSCPIPLLFPIAGIALAGTLSGLNPTTARPLGTSEPPQLASQPSTTGGHAASNTPKPTLQPPTPTEGFAPGGGLPALPASLVEKIRGGSFVDLGDLLPEHVFEAFVDGDDKEKKKKRKSHEIETFQDWVLGYTTWASTIVASNPERGLSSLQYLGVIGRLARDNPRMCGAIMTSNSGRWPLQYPSQHSGVNSTSNFCSGQSKKTPTPLNHGRPASAGMRVGFASSPHASESIPAPPVASHIGQWPVLPHLYHTSPLGAPGCPILDRHRPLQPHTAAAESQNHTNLRP